MNSKIKIMICCHKPTDVCVDDIFLPIQVGYETSSFDIKIQKDNQINGQKCENISAYNGIYCEMTAMYWAWKNIRILHDDIDYIGLCHYRRYFYIGNCYPKKFLLFCVKKIKTIIKILLGLPCGFVIYDPKYSINSIKEKTLQKSNEKLKTIIKNYDLITSKPCRLINTTVADYFKILGREYIDLLTEIVDNEYVNFKKYYHKVISGNKLFSANMLIIRIDLLDDYCSFVFNVLQRHLTLTKQKGLCMEPYHEKIYSRVSGYLAEILTCTYIFYCENKYNIRIIDKCFIENM